MAGNSAALVERLLTLGQAAELLGTSERFPRRLIADRRIRFVRAGRHVRIPESALAEFIAVGVVEPVIRRRRWRAREEGSAVMIGRGSGAACGLTWDLAWWAVLDLNQ